MTRREADSTPRPLVDRLGVKPGMSIAAVGVSEPGLLAAVRARAGAVTVVDLPSRAAQTRELPPLGSLGTRRDLVFLEAADAETLALVPRLVAALAADGALWVLWPKGRGEIGQSAVMAAGLAAGVVDVKVTSVSGRASALRFVFRLKDRAARR